MAEITISGYQVLVDDEDVERIQEHYWRPDRNIEKNPNNWYLVSKMKIEGKWYNIRLHRFLMNCPPTGGLYVDHINNNTLDNRKMNLRFATVAENAANTIRKVKSASGYKGVHWNDKSGKWVARVGRKTKGVYLGYWDKPEDAAKDYDMMMLEIYGEFAATNFPKETYLLPDGSYMKYERKRKALYKNNTSGIVGVKKAKNGRWIAAYRYHKHTYNVGRFDTPEEAKEALDKHRNETIKKLENENA